MRHVLATALLTLAFATPAVAGSLGEVTAATGIQGTLARQGTGSSKSALGSVKSSLAKSTKPRDYDFGGGGGGKRGGRPAGSTKGAPRSGGGGGSGWVTGASASRGNSSSAWLKGGSGWGSGSGGGRASQPRRRS